MMIGGATVPFSTTTTTASEPSSSSPPPPPPPQSQPQSYDQEYEEYKTEIEDIMKAKDAKEKRKQAIIGQVVSTKNAKTITIKVNRYTYIPKYQTYRRKTKKFMAHDEKEEASLGDIVRIVQSRPISARKRHIMSDIIRHEPQLTIDLEKLAAEEAEKEKALVLAKRQKALAKKAAKLEKEKEEAEALATAAAAKANSN